MASTASVRRSSSIGWLTRLVERSATWRERCDRGRFAPLADPGDAEARYARWIAGIAGGDSARFERLLAERGIDRSGFQRGLIDVRLRRGTALPDWARILGRMLRADPTAAPTFRLGELADDADLRSAGFDPDEAWPLQPVFAPLAAFATAAVDVAVQRTPCRVTRSARRGMVTQIVRTWTVLSAEVFFHRFGLEDLIAGGAVSLGGSVRASCFRAGRPARAGWRAVFDLYPVLGRCLGQAALHWRTALEESLARLAADREDLQRLGLIPRGPLTVTGYRGGLGDPHAGGRSVAIFVCGKACQLVYKPRDQAIAVAFQRLIADLSARGLRPGLADRRILARRGYGWEAFVATEECARRSDVRNYYRRMGAYARLLQLLDATDFTTDNVLASGSSPVLIDLETLCSPRLGDAGPERLADTPIRSGIVTAPVAGPGGLTADLGALAPPSRRTAPFRQTAAVREPDGTTRRAQVYQRFGGNSSSPVLAGRAVPVDRYVPDVMHGYVEMGRALRALAPKLRSDGHYGKELSGCQVRFLARDTHIYARLLQESLKPSRLRSGLDRQLWLDRLWKGRFGKPAVVAEEIAALERLDIPLFTATVGDHDLRAAGGRSIPRFFAEPAAAHIDARIELLMRRSEDDERDLIRSALFQLAPNLARPTPIQRAGPARSNAGSDLEVDLLALAAELGHRIEALGVTTPTGRAWLGLSFDPRSADWALGRLPEVDLYSGVAGLAVTFAELYRSTGDPAFRTAALDAIRPSVASLPDREIVRPGGAGWPAGIWCGFVGPGAAVYAVTRVAIATAESGLLAEVTRAVADLADAPPESLPSDPEARGALSLALIPYRRHSGPAAALDGLLLRLVPLGAAPGSAPRAVDPADELPTQATLLALAEWRFRRLSDPTARPAACPRPRTTADWLAMGELGGRVPGPIPSWLAQAPHLAVDLAHGPITDLRGGLDHLRAKRLARQLRRRHQRSGRWLPNSLAPDVHLLSATRGLAALARACSGLATGLTGPLLTLHPGP